MKRYLSLVRLDMVGKGTSPPRKLCAMAGNIQEEIEPRTY